jgi:hypothetical protein
MDHHAYFEKRENKRLKEVKKNGESTVVKNWKAQGVPRAVALKV